MSAASVLRGKFFQGSGNPVSPSDNSSRPDNLLTNTVALTL